MQCDIAIPVYNQLPWVKMCLKAVFCNTNMAYINKIYLIDDCSSKETKEGLKELALFYGDKIILIHNKKNQGFVKNCNFFFQKSKAEYVLLLNSDCLVSNRAIEKMLFAMKKNKKIGLLCPISSKAANLSFPLPLGYDYQKVNEMFEKEFTGKMFDACTVVGNCLMISRKCLNEVGYFDEIFERGYSEETDYQFRALKKGFLAKVLIDTYVFHECRVSFGEDEKQLAIRSKHLDIFFARWKEEYDKLWLKYQENDPIVYIKEHLSFPLESDLKNEITFCLHKKMDDTELKKTIDFLNYNIIENRRMKIFSMRDDWQKYNTLFYPQMKRGFIFKR